MDILDRPSRFAKLGFICIVLAIVGIGWMSKSGWTYEGHKEIMTSGESDCEAYPVFKHYPIESAYREKNVLYVNTFDRERYVQDGKEVEFVNSYAVTVSKDQKAYSINHRGELHLFMFSREMVSGVCLEYITYKGEKIPVTVFGDDTK